MYGLYIQIYARVHIASEIKSASLNKIVRVNANKYKNYERVLLCAAAAAAYIHQKYHLIFPRSIYYYFL